MKKKIMLVVSSMVLIIAMLTSLVACGYSIKNVDKFMIDFAKSDSKAITTGTTIMAIDGKDTYVKLGKMETYSIVDGEKVDVYVTLDGVKWSHASIDLADMSNDGLDDLVMTDEELKDKLKDIEEDYSNFDEKFTEGDDGFWYANDDALQTIGFKMDGKKLISKASLLGVSSETSMEIGYSIKLPSEAKKAKK